MENNKLSELLEQFSDPAIALSNDEVIAANSAAKCGFLQPGETPVVLELSDYELEVDGVYFRFAAELNSNVRLFIAGDPDDNNPYFQLLRRINSFLREELGVTNASLTLLNRKLRNDEDVRKYLNIMQRSRSKLHRLADNLTDMLDEDRELFKPIAFDLSELCGKLVSTVMSLLEESSISIEFSNHCEPGTSVVLGDPAKIERMLLNLISNAVLFAPVSGCDVKLTTTSSEGQVAVTLSQLYSESPPELEFMLFNSYKHSKPSSRSGLGLGLSAALHVARQHGGNIIASQRENVIDFSVIIPTTLGDKRLEDSAAFTVGETMSGVMTALAEIISYEKFGPPFIEH